MESSPNQEEKGLLVLAMLDHGGAPWDHKVVGQDPTLKVAEILWINYISMYHPKGEKKCWALQWLAFDLASVLQNRKSNASRAHKTTCRWLTVKYLRCGMITHC